jgi:serine/threonine protein kinase
VSEGLNTFGGKPVVTMTRYEPSGFSTEQLRDFNECASRLDLVLRASPASVDLRSFLPAPGQPHRLACLCELIKRELEACYRRRQDRRLEEYLLRYPELGGPESLPPDLIYEEYRIRHLYGDKVSLDQYRERFASQFEQVRLLVQRQPAATVIPSSYPTPALASRKMETADKPAVANGRLDASDGTLRPTKLAAGSAAPSGAAARLDKDLILSGGQGYRKLDRLGRGEFGEVWRALAPGDVEVAVKVILRTLDHDASQRELKALEKIRQLRHPYLLQTHQYQSEMDHLVIVLELADKSLMDRLEECRDAGLPGVPLEELVTFFGQVAEALDYLHSEHVSHRDIKPQNLLMLRGYAKVADFGLARAHDEARADASMVCGTPYYMPPEAWNQRICRNSDQYSLAATYVEARLGRRLFDGKAIYDIADQHIRAVPQLDPLPEAEQQVLLRALAKDPDQRFPTCTAFVQALKATTAPPPVPVPKAGLSTRILVALVSCCLIGVLLTLYLVLFRPATPPPGRPEGKQPDAGPWTPPGWSALDSTEWADSKGHRYSRNIACMKGDQKVVMVLVPQTSSTDPAPFYIMENKVWNDLYRVFMDDPESKKLFVKYSSRDGCSDLVNGQWQRGAWAPGRTPPNDYLGVDGEQRSVPAMGMKVTEAHCFAEWLGGRLPKDEEYRKAAGLNDSPPDFLLDNRNADDLAFNLGMDGPWSVRRGNRDISTFGCRQMLTNGREYTRTIFTREGKAVEEIPLTNVTIMPSVVVLGYDYLSLSPPALQTIKRLGLPCNNCDGNGGGTVGFRVVLRAD